LSAPPTACRSRRLIADLKSEEAAGPARTRHIGGLGGRFLRRAGVEIEPIDEPPVRARAGAAEASRSPKA